MQTVSLTVTPTVTPTTTPTPTQIPARPSPGCNPPAFEPEFWNMLSARLDAADPWPVEPCDDPLEGVPMRTYEVTDVRAGAGFEIEQWACTTEAPPRFWIDAPSAAGMFLPGDVFLIGWNDEETVVWPPSRWLSEPS